MKNQAVQPAKINFKIDFCRIKIQFVKIDFLHLDLSKIKYRSRGGYAAAWFLQWFVRLASTTHFENYTVPNLHCKTKLHGDAGVRMSLLAFYPPGFLSRHLNEFVLKFTKADDVTRPCSNKRRQFSRLPNFHCICIFKSSYQIT